MPIIPGSNTPINDSWGVNIGAEPWADRNSRENASTLSLEGCEQVDFPDWINDSFLAEGQVDSQSIFFDQPHG
jgi:hypothetical protein